jgi:DNA-binding NtrC family response regulator
MKKICKVLIVEDDSDLQEVLSFAFSDDGYHFAMARTGAEARTALASDPDIDIAIIDIHLPGSDDGFVLAQEAATRGLPVILTSGDHTRAEEMEKSGHRHILKPYRLASLLELIDETLKATKAKCERAASAA